MTRGENICTTITPGAVGARGAHIYLLHQLHHVHQDYALFSILLTVLCDMPNS